MKIRKEWYSSKTDIPFIKEKERAKWAENTSCSKESRNEWKRSEGLKAEREEDQEKVDVENWKDPIRKERGILILTRVFGEFGEYERIEWHGI